MIQAVIFDVDGTLLNSDQAIILALQQVLREEKKMEYPSEELIPVLGMTSENCLNFLGVSDVKRVAEKLTLYVKRNNHMMILYPGIEEMLKKLVGKGIHTGVVTSKTLEEFIVDFMPHGISELFSHIICADDTSRHKPEPDPLLKYVEQTKINPTTTLYVGDTVFDQKCANGAQIDFALAMWGAKQPERTVAKYSINRPDDLLRIVGLE
ncbi:HAD family hydrolase [Cytobacillus solani]|uniref:HAD family hydrolase n=1 Tax=Cytobacillus solani TaxID=1637975 RepID=UPI0011508D8F|nr:HAD family hydrolase [Cytobacillus solani]USK57109.1 HAD family hydrolase [Cytobacillus solani]